MDAERRNEGQELLAGKRDGIPGNREQGPLNKDGRRPRSEKDGDKIDPDKGRFGRGGFLVAILRIRRRHADVRTMPRSQRELIAAGESYLQTS
ncbi:hypothetical protein J6590_001946 [Homalodisca vitripennis]|nr:hypothetical protein J6590_001946 [Homalodisca vitripennis]